jgi:hypothetical protein
MRWDGCVARMGEINAYRIVVGEYEGKRPLERINRRWEYNIKINVKE